MLRELKAFLSRHRLATVAVAGIAIALLIVGFSPMFQECVKANQEYEARHTFGEYLGAFIWSVWWCGGIFSKENGEALTAFASIAIGVFTWTLWWATTDQGRLTQKAIADSAIQHRTSNRAFAYLKRFETHKIIDGNGVVISLLASPMWFNSGHTPTAGARVQVDWVRQVGDLPPDFAYGYRELPFEIFIPPDVEIGSNPITLPHNAFNALEGENPIRTYIWGRIDFGDVFGPGQHVTRFCYRVDARRADEDGVLMAMNFYGPHNGYTPAD